MPQLCGCKGSQRAPCLLLFSQDLLPLHRLVPLQAQVGVTPERARAERRQLAEQAEQAEAEAQAAKLRVQRLEAVLAFEVRF